ncbi:MAG TPA: hypothetical protein PLH48_08830 [Acinetobacter johnsonii]|nr:hypothetical protein [Acinetobacter johnsonii]
MADYKTILLKLLRPTADYKTFYAKTKMERIAQYYVLCLTPLQFQSVKQYHDKNTQTDNNNQKSEPFLLEINKISQNCFKPFENWIPPTKDEISIIFKLSNLTQSQISSKLGLKDTNGRTFRRYLNGSVPIPYATWVLLCEIVGIVGFWK